MITTLEEFNVYNLALKLGGDIWSIVIKWSYFEKDTVGKQFVRAADSIAANLSEGLGRYQFKESKNFGYYSRGSLFETKTWLTKSFNPGFISDSDYQKLIGDLNIIGKKLNSYISSIGTVSEPEENYGLPNA